MTSTRRGLLAASAALPLAGVAVAADPDAGLLRLVADFHRADAESKRLDAICRAADEEDDDAATAWDASCDERDSIEERILPITPATSAGLRAKAGVSRVTFERRKQSGEKLEFELLFAERVVLDVLSLHGPAA